MNNVANPIALSCRLSKPELRKHKEEVVQVLKNEVKQKNKLKNGYEYTFVDSDEVLEQLFQFLKIERQCCPFFEFIVNVSSGEIHLAITGPEGTTEFIEYELEL